MALLIHSLGLLAQSKPVCKPLYDSGFTVDLGAESMLPNSDWKPKSNFRLGRAYKNTRVFPGAVLCLNDSQQHRGKRSLSMQKEAKIQ